VWRPFEIAGITKAIDRGLRYMVLCYVLKWLHVECMYSCILPLSAATDFLCILRRRTTFENALFLFVAHAFDVGDVLWLDNSQWR
jgi:hypothetical protein